MKIAITGANGFVGSTMLTHFSQKGFEPVAIVRKAFFQNGIITRVVDYSDTFSLTNALSDVDILIHNAGKTKSIGQEEMLSVNLGLTRKIVDVVNAQKHPIRLIYISSQAAGGPSSREHPMQETDAPRPISIYGKSKAMAESLIQKQCNKTWSIVRPCSVYGPGDRDFLSLFKLSKLGFQMQIGKQERSLNMIHVSQLAEFILHLIGNPQVKNEIFYATDNQVYTQSEIAAHIAAIAGKSIHKLVIPSWAAQIAFGLGQIVSRMRSEPSAMNLDKYNEIIAEGWVANPEKAKNLLGWDPPARLPELIKETYKWYCENSWL
ncbi:MAG: sugar nucleotide-binding protein [Candidatus Cloacimonetes bacterium]|jgi:nucleoside-diphosphate-sugar epimerase|nr:sugar nucleotide-binding protein [Candidatus Cloacimonadota bacterium]MDD2507075.1 sugar nucleotide-binding protein [Candidatus Cloacimonadota bacterium]MDD4559975.1 sugar nucleotide-binding protein [Candidatus Cloacimonadota bacterium]